MDRIRVSKIGLLHSESDDWVLAHQRPLWLLATHVPTSWKGIPPLQSALVVRSGTAAEVSVETGSISAIQLAVAFTIERKLVSNLVRVLLNSVTCLSPGGGDKVQRSRRWQRWRPTRPWEFETMSRSQRPITLWQWKTRKQMPCVWHRIWWHFHLILYARISMPLKPYRAETKIQKGTNPKSTPGRFSAKVCGWGFIQWPWTDKAPHKAKSQ